MMQNRLRRNAAAMFATAALLVGVTACGTETGGADPQANANPAVDPKTPAPVSGSVVLTKTGGFAGVNETVRVRLDGGKATLAAQGKEKVTCTVDAAMLASLEEEAGLLVANGVKEKKEKGPKGHDSKVADAFNYSLKVNDQEFTYQGGEKIPRNVRPLMSAMTEILASAKDSREGNSSADGTVECS